MISVEQALKFIDQTVQPLPPETRLLAESVGSILIDDIKADVDSPPHDKSMMDGFAVRSADVAGGQKRLKVSETIIAGGWPTRKLEQGHAARIMTGAPIPDGADAVVMVELTEVEKNDDAEIVTLKVDSIAPEKHILRTGVNFANGQTVFQKSHVVRPTDIGLLAEVGAAKVAVGNQPTISILPTGNELVDCSNVPGRGQIRNSNGPMLIAMARGLLAQGEQNVKDLGVGRDDADQLRELIEQGLETDLLLLSGGVSAGTMDLVPGILSELGVRQVFHKVRVKPGKPIWFGILERESGKPTYVFGLPGNPVSSLVGFRLFVCAAVCKLMGGVADLGSSVTAELSRDHETRGDRPTFWPGRWANEESCTRKVEPLDWRGSSDLLALGQAEGLIFFPAECHQNKTGQSVQFYPL